MAKLIETLKQTKLSREDKTYLIISCIPYTLLTCTSILMSLIFLAMYAWLLCAIAFGLAVYNMVQLYKTRAQVLQEIIDDRFDVIDKQLLRRKGGRT